MLTQISINLLFAFIGGILPAIIWLWFWLKEDSEHPEPNKLIIKTFLLGMGMVPIAFIFQNIINYLFLDGKSSSLLSLGGGFTVLIIMTWSFIEEFVKYVAAKNGGLDSKSNDEPIDAPIYMITAALGFAALENFLFLITPLFEGDLGGAFLTGNMRFIGATLVHVASSALIGILGSLSYFLKKEAKKFYLIIGFVLATLLHGIFNLFIINHNEIAYLGFVTVWVFIVIIILLFEKIKKIKISKI